MFCLTRKKTLLKLSLTVSLLFLVIATLVLTMSSTFAYWHDKLGILPNKDVQTNTDIKPFFPLPVKDHPSGYNNPFTRMIRKDNKYYVPVYEGEYEPGASGYSNWGRFKRISKFYDKTHLYYFNEVLMYKNASGDYEVYKMIRTQPSMWGYYNLLGDAPSNGMYFRRQNNLTINASPSTATLPLKNYNIVFTTWNLYFPGDIVYNIDDGYLYIALNTHTAIAKTNYRKYSNGLFDITNIYKPPHDHNTGVNKFWEKVRYLQLNTLETFYNGEVIATTRIISGIPKLYYYKYVGLNGSQFIFNNTNISNNSFFAPLQNNYETREW